MTDQERTWLDNLKVGDEVLCASVHNKGILRTVSATTPAQVIIRACGYEYRYWRKTGRIVGGKSGWLVQP